MTDSQPRESIRADLDKAHRDSEELIAGLRRDFYSPPDKDIYTYVQALERSIHSRLTINVGLIHENAELRQKLGGR